MASEQPVHSPQHDAAARRVRFRAADAAVIVIDVQNDFCHPDGVLARQGRDVARVHPAVERLTTFLDDARRADVPIVFVQNVHDEASDTGAWRARHPDCDREQSCQDGTWGAEFFAVAPAPGDHVVVKHRYDAFTGTDLEQLLRRLGRSSLLFTGVTTSVCVESSLRAAVCRDFLATLVEDCCGAYSDRAHQRGVESVVLGFGVAACSDELRAAWAHDAAGSQVGVARS